jgi:hypothetical protein
VQLHLSASRRTLPKRMPGQMSWPVLEGKRYPARGPQQQLGDGGGNVAFAWVSGSIRRGGLGLFCSITNNDMQQVII